MKEYMTHVLSRINRFTGEAYASDPRIFAYEVMNEPRNKNGRNDNSVARWLQEMASHFRTLDTQHMLTVGLDGFFSSSTPELQAYNPYNGAELEGIDFLNIAKIPEFDFIGIHAHVDEWCTC
jgi:mannan endo-1,4-beta-mannosidase